MALLVDHAVLSTNVLSSVLLGTAGSLSAELVDLVAAALDSEGSLGQGLLISLLLLLLRFGNTTAES